MHVVFESDVKGHKLIKRGKVRDVYEVDDTNHLLIVACDRISAFDVVMPTPIPEKGRILTQMSNFWFVKTRNIIPNHIVDDGSGSADDGLLSGDLNGRAVIVKKAESLLVEAIVRGYISGSGWKEYLKNGHVCGIRLPDGLKESDKLPEPIFTPTTKAPQGSHDENITFEQTTEIIGMELAKQVRDISLALYSYAADYALKRGIIIADTKFEFGLVGDNLILIDEVLTPDSSRFWPLDKYQPGGQQPSFDKQYVRDYLESIGWNKTPPAPDLPLEIVSKTAEKYAEALNRIV
jgi:phosphoribosylaminoimidazole-succinocarboxamide synthase